MTLRLRNQKLRTQKVINHFRGLPGEFSMLKGLLCASHSMEGHDEVRYRYFFDSSLIAARMEEINAAAREEAMKFLGERAQ
ncbi:hypothetical protein K788_0000280 [Paraburkholderia caribensis MBA4]|uniref:Uncharacterized protein n=1 Tax=Paraburkholderia caribensis MBA4 TaxID=1323664 RepID=A0A0P0RIV6_9BURK|nr:hypothetical protein [Paraburkholderia caribensis]ALL68697.1 hypothetical protein K788_0000280 [Paraburkholderia caribensis MBA4]